MSKQTKYLRISPKSNYQHKAEAIAFSLMTPNNINTDRVKLFLQIYIIIVIYCLMQERH